MSYANNENLDEISLSLEILMNTVFEYDKIFQVSKLWISGLWASSSISTLFAKQFAL